MLQVPVLETDLSPRTVSQLTVPRQFWIIKVVSFLKVVICILSAFLVSSSLFYEMVNISLSKLTTSLVNDSLKFQMIILQNYKYNFTFVETM